MNIWCVWRLQYSMLRSALIYIYVFVRPFYVEILKSLRCVLYTKIHIILIASTTPHATHACASLWTFFSKNDVWCARSPVPYPYPYLAQLQLSVLPLFPVLCAPPGDVRTHGLHGVVDIQAQDGRNFIKEAQDEANKIKLRQLFKVRGSV